MRYRDVYELPVDKNPKVISKKYEPDIVMVAKGRGDTGHKMFEVDLFFQTLLFAFGTIAFGAFLMKFYEGL